MKKEIKKLTKEEMRLLSGGRMYQCTCIGSSTVINVEANNITDANNLAQEKCSDSEAECS